MDEPHLLQRDLLSFGLGLVKQGLTEDNLQRGQDKHKSLSDTPMLLI